MTDLYDVRVSSGVWNALGMDEAIAGVDRALLSRMVDEVNLLINQEAEEREKRRERRLGRVAERQLAMALTMNVLMKEGSERARRGLDMWSEAQETALRDDVLDRLFGVGRIQRLLLNPEVEDIYIAGTRPVHLRMADGSLVEVPPIADTVEELMSQLRSIATYGGSQERQMVSSRPIIDMRLPDGQRAAAMWDVTPEPHITIRCHRFVDVSLQQLVGMGMLSQAMAHFLDAAVRAGRTIVVIGPQGAGKTTLIRALAQAIPRSERYATIETEYELFLHTIADSDGRLRWPLLIPVEARPGTGEKGPDGKPAGEMSIADLFPATLRHSLTRLIVGEMRAEEIVPTLMAAARGLRGSITSFHANSAQKTFNSLRSAVTFYSHNVSAEAAMGLVADAIDYVVCVDRENTKSGTVRFVSEILEVGDNTTEAGIPTSAPIFEPDKTRGDIDPRGYPKREPEDKLWARRAGLSMSWLKPARGEWAAPFPPRDLA